MIICPSGVYIVVWTYSSKTSVGTVCFIFCTARTQMLCQHFRYRHRPRLHRQVNHRCIVFGPIWDFRRCCDVLSSFFDFLCYCCTYVTSMIICPSGVYIVVWTYSSKRSSWYCLLHLLYRKDTNALPTLQVQTPAAPPSTSPSQVHCLWPHLRLPALLWRSELFFWVSMLLLYICNFDDHLSIRRLHGGMDLLQ